MGTDVHAVIEVNEYPNDKEDGWHSFAKLSLWRSYYMFGLMAGMRCPDLELFAPRGWPEHMGWCTQEWASGDHTPSWLTTEEFKRCVEACPDGGPPHDYFAVLAAMEAIEKRGKRCRLVFNFDS